MDMDCLSHKSVSCNFASACDQLCQGATSFWIWECILSKQAFSFHGCFPCLSLPFVKTFSGCGDSTHTYTNTLTQWFLLLPLHLPVSIQRLRRLCHTWHLEKQSNAKSQKYCWKHDGERGEWLARGPVWFYTRRLAGTSQTTQDSLTCERPSQCWLINKTDWRQEGWFMYNESDDVSVNHAWQICAPSSWRGKSVQMWLLYFKNMIGKFVTTQPVGK